MSIQKAKIKKTLFLYYLYLISLDQILIFLMEFMKQRVEWWLGCGGGGNWRDVDERIKILVGKEE